MLFATALALWLVPLWNVVAVATDLPWWAQPIGVLHWVLVVEATRLAGLLGGWLAAVCSPLALDMALLLDYLRPGFIVTLENTNELGLALFIWSKEFAKHWSAHVTKYASSWISPSDLLVHVTAFVLVGVIIWYRLRQLSADLKDGGPDPHR